VDHGENLFSRPQLCAPKNRRHDASQLIGDSAPIVAAKTGQIGINFPPR
jgi:hypothetical protein